MVFISNLKKKFTIVGKSRLAEKFFGTRKINVGTPLRSQKMSLSVKLKTNAWDITRHVSQYFQFPNTCVFLVELWSNRGLPFLTSFVASTHLIRSGVGVIDNPDQSCQHLEQYGTSEVLYKNFSGDFSMACRQNMLILVFSKHVWAHLFIITFTKGN